MKYQLKINKATGERLIIENRGIHGQWITREAEKPEEYARLRKLALSNIKRQSRDNAMRDCGLVKVRGSQGGVYWE